MTVSGLLLRTVQPVVMDLSLYSLEYEFYNTVISIIIIIIIVIIEQNLLS